MKAADVQRMLTLYNTANIKKRVEAIATELRAASLLPSGGRGAYAPDVSALEAARFTIAVAGSERVSDAVEVASDLAVIVNSSGELLIDRIMRIVGGADPANNVRAIRVCAPFAAAEILNNDGSYELFFRADKWANADFVPEAQLTGYIGPIGHIGGAVLDQLALEFKDNDARYSDRG